MPQSLYDYKEILQDLWLIINSTRFMANSQMREVDFIYGVANYDYCIQWKVASYKVGWYFKLISHFQKDES